MHSDYNHHRCYPVLDSIVILLLDTTESTFLTEMQGEVHKFSIQVEVGSWNAKQILRWKNKLYHSAHCTSNPFEIEIGVGVMIPTFRCYRCHSPFPLTWRSLRWKKESPCSHGCTRPGTARTLSCSRDEPWACTCICRCRNLNPR